MKLFLTRSLALAGLTVFATACASGAANIAPAEAPAPEKPAPPTPSAQLAKKPQPLAGTHYEAQLNSIALSWDQFLRGTEPHNFLASMDGRRTLGR